MNNKHNYFQNSNRGPNKFSTWILPKMIVLACLLNVPLTYFGLPFLYGVLCIFGIFLLLNNVKINLNSLSDAIMVILLFLIFINFIKTVFTSTDITSLELAKALFAYIMPFTYWFLLSRQKTSSFDAIKFFYSFRYIVLIIAILVLVQFYFSPSLFGLLSGVESESLQWAIDSDFYSYSAFFRASSILGSPQVFGLFIILYAAVYIIIINKVDVFSVIYLISGMYSGNKSFYLLLGLLLIFLLFKKRFKSRWLILFSIIIISIFISGFSRSSFGFVSRVFNFSEIRSEEKEGRLAVYKDVITQTNVFGHELGSKMIFIKKSYSTVVTESFLLQLLFELGIVFMIPFILWLYLILKKTCNKDLLFLRCIFILSFIFVHAHLVCFIFIFWAFMFDYSSSENSREILSVEK